jgi:hypothetical protein
MYKWSPKVCIENLVCIRHFLNALLKPRLGDNGSHALRTESVLVHKPSLNFCPDSEAVGFDLPISIESVNGTTLECFTALLVCLELYMIIIHQSNPRWYFILLIVPDGRQLNLIEWQICPDFLTP